MGLQSRRRLRPVGLRTRLELLALEAADEKARLLKLLGMAFAALLFLTLAVLVFTVSIAVAFWPTENRYLALGLLAGLYAVLGVAAGRGQAGAALWPPFSATLEELGRDAEPRRRGGLSHDQAFSWSCWLWRRRMKARLLKLLGMAFAALLFLTLAVLVFCQHRGGVLAHRKPLSGAGPAGGSVRGAGCGAAGRGQAGAALWPAAVLGHAGRAGPRRGLLERVRDAHDEDPRRRGEDEPWPSVLPPSTARCASSCCARAHRARIPGPGHRQRRPQAGAGLAHQEPAADWRRPAMRHAGPCRPSAWRAVIHWSARRCPPCSCVEASAFAC